MPYNYKTELDRYRRYYQSLEPLLKKSKAQNYTAVIFSFLVVSLFGFYAIRPTIQTILTLKREIQDKTDVSRKMEEKITSLIEAQAAYSQIESSVPLVNQAIPDAPDAIPLIIQMRNLANATGVTLSTVQMPAVPLLGSTQTTNTKTSVTHPPAKQEPLEFSMGVVGSYDGIQAFLTGILDMRRIVTIKSVSVTPNRAIESVGSESATPIGQQLQLSLILISYYLIQ
jgi:Tfp pilus assembly protein PilO